MTCNRYLLSFLAGKTSLTVFQNLSGLDRFSSSLFLKKFRFVRFIKFMTRFFNLRYAFQSGSSFDFWALRSSLSRVFMCFLTSVSSHGDGLLFTFFDVSMYINYIELHRFQVVKSFIRCKCIINGVPV